MPTAAMTPTIDPAALANAAHVLLYLAGVTAHSWTFYDNVPDVPPIINAAIDEAIEASGEGPHRRLEWAGLVEVSFVDRDQEIIAVLIRITDAGREVAKAMLACLSPSIETGARREAADRETRLHDTANVHNAESPSAD